MKPTLEAPRLVSDDESFMTFERREASFDWSWHYHSEIELTWIGRGSGTRLVGDHSGPYGPHDLVLLGSGLPHTWFSSGTATRKGDHQAVVIKFSPRSLPEALLVLPEFAAIGGLLARAERGLHFPNAIGRRTGAAMKDLLNRTGLGRWLHLAEVLNELATAAATPLASPGYRPRRSGSDSRLERVTGHIENHYREEITLAEIARLAGLTPSAFSKFFRRMTHQTFVSYRNDRRIREACRLLTETDTPVIRIAHECGFNNLANFNRRFRESKAMVPREYRRLHDSGPPRQSRSRFPDFASGDARGDAV